MCCVPVHVSCVVWYDYVYIYVCVCVFYLCVHVHVCVYIPVSCLHLCLCVIVFVEIEVKIERSAYPVEFGCDKWSWSVPYGGEVCCMEVEYTTWRSLPPTIYNQGNCEYISRNPK